VAKLWAETKLFLPFLKQNVVKFNLFATHSLRSAAASRVGILFGDVFSNNEH